jgi:hypothetical protein
MHLVTVGSLILVNEKTWLVVKAFEFGRLGVRASKILVSLCM